MRNQQIQKLFNEYNYDRETAAALSKSELSKQDTPASISEKTTKFTTINTLPKIS